MINLMEMVFFDGRTGESMLDTSKITRDMNKALNLLNKEK